MKNMILEKVLNSNKNLIVSGNIETGKTTRILFPVVDDIIEKNESLFIIDSKEEYLNKYYDKFKNNNYNVIIFNLRDLNISESWNPLSYPYSLYKNGEQDRALDYITKIVNNIFTKELEESDPFWRISASNFTTGLIIGLFEDGDESQINFASVGSMLNSVNEKFGVKSFIDEYFEMKSYLVPFYNLTSSILLAPAVTRDSIFSVAKQGLGLYTVRKNLSRFLNVSTTEYKDIISKPSVIFFIGREDSTSTNSLISMYIEQLYSCLFNNKFNNKFNFILDGIDSLNKVDGLSDMMSSCLAKNMRIILATRNIDLFIEKYGLYVNNLANILKINNSTIELKVNDEIFVEDNDLMSDDGYNILVNRNIEYPVLNNKEIEIFNLRNYVCEIKRNQLQEKMNNFEQNKPLNIFEDFRVNFPNNKKED